MNKQKLKELSKQAVGKSLDKKKNDRKREKLLKEIKKVERKAKIANWLTFFGFSGIAGIIRGVMKKSFAGNPILFFVVILVIFYFFVMAWILRSKAKRRLEEIEVELAEAQII